MVNHMQSILISKRKKTLRKVIEINQQIVTINSLNNIHS